jgi:hypothetical protein
VLCRCGASNVRHSSDRRGSPAGAQRHGQATAGGDRIA